MKLPICIIAALLPLAASAEALHEQAHEGLPLKAVQLRDFHGLSVTNSMAVTWLVVLGLVLISQLATRNMQQVPGPLQNLVEWVVESLYNFLESIMGQHLAKKTFWFFASLFLFILCSNWLGLLPGVGTIGWGEQTATGFAVERPLFRGVNADLNTTLAMATVFFVLWIVWALQAQGFMGVVKHLFGSKGGVTGIFGLFIALVFLAAGLLEVVSILFRPISLSLRLFGNIYAGENMLETMGHMVPGLGWLLPIPFYFMELLVGAVQAIVFMLLTAVFTLIICEHSDEGQSSAHPTH